ncbi:MAG: hypothetical protein NTY64_16835 [Deltaproteobacteria bacterium]|nr:hypothetical protein [Deltaproteobacteria bacterium]
MALPDPFYNKVLRECRNHRLTALLVSQGEGRLAGVPMAQNTAKVLGIEGTWKKHNGEEIRK